MQQINSVTDIPVGAMGYLVGAARVESMSPSEYRLARKPDGTLVLQGAFMWQKGITSGHEWRDIPTVEL